MAQPEFYWPVASQKKYGYWSKPLPFNCNPGQNGNYIFTKLVNNTWVSIYIGQGDLNERVNDPTHYKCATGKGAGTEGVLTTTATTSVMARQGPGRGTPGFNITASPIANVPETIIVISAAFLCTCGGRVSPAQYRLIPTSISGWEKGLERSCPQPIRRRNP